MGTLNAAQQANLQIRLQANDPSGYYNVLESAGIKYGELAGGVVDQNSISGRVAIEFLKLQGKQEYGITVTASMEDQIEVSLMQADYNARLAVGFTEIGFEEIRECHEDVFELYGMGEEAWTAIAPLDVAARHYNSMGFSTPEAAEQFIWNSVLEYGFRGQSLIYGIMYSYGYRGVIFGDPQAREWFVEATQAALVGDTALFCFLPGTPIAMWGAPDKPIEAVVPGDLVMSYDSAGRLVPGRVSRVFTNEVHVIVDLFGLMLTPGHVTLCGEGEHAGRHVPVLDILRTDGALVMRDGSHVRAATGCEVGSEGDAWVAAVVGEPRGEGRVHVTEARHLRAGTRVIMPDGRDVSVLEAIRAAGGEVGPDGWVRPCGEPEAEGQPFHWAFSDHLPASEDYVLARSGTTLSDIYAADEWEAVPPLGDAPEGVPASWPEPNLPLALRGLDDPLAARGGAFAPSDATRARTMGALPH